MDRLKVSLTGIFLLALLGFTPGSAEAGQFSVAMCGEKSVSAHQFRFDRNSKKFRAVAACGGKSSAGLKLEAVEGKTSTSHWGQWRTESPAQLPIVAWELRASIRDSDGITGRVCFDRAAIGIRCYGADTNGSYRLHGSVASDGKALSLRLGCFMQKGCSGGKRAHIFARGVMLTIADRIEPSLDISGPALSPGIKAGETFVRVDASDQESGVESLDVSVNGKRIDSGYSARCAQTPTGVFTAYSPCPTQMSQAVVLDTESEPFVDGTNQVEVCVSDVASEGLGDANRECAQQSIEVDNSCPDSRTGVTAMRAGIGTSLESDSVLDYGVPPNLRGIVTSGTGSPIAGAVVCLQQRTLGTSEVFGEFAELNTGTDGHFEIKLGIGPSREFRLLQRSGSVVWVREVTLRVRTRPTIRLSRSRLKGGGCIRIEGGIPGPLNGGVVLALQGRAKGFRNWTTFAAPTTDSTGAFSHRYCFRSTSRTTTYELRATVQQQGIYPYLPGISDPRRVKVTRR